MREDFLDVAAIALRAVGDEDFVGLDGAAAGGVVVLGDGFAQERVALLGTVALEGAAAAHFIHGFMHRIAHGLRESFGDIADAQPNDLGIGVCSRLGAGFDTINTADAEKHGVKVLTEDEWLELIGAG